MKKVFNYILLCIVVFLSCKKSDFLSAKPDESLLTPKTIADFQAILDNEQIMNGDINTLDFPDPFILLTGVDDYYVPPNNFQYIPFIEYRNQYTWGDNIYRSNEEQLVWDRPYKAIFYANVAYDGISKIKPAPDEQAAYNNVKGSALFYRAHQYYQLAQIFAPQYDSITALQDWGLVLRLKPDVNEEIKRSTVQQSYDQIINDLKTASNLLPNTPLYTTRPSKAAAFAMLAKTYLLMQKYQLALKYADSCLQIKNDLLDYNNLPTSSSPVIPRNNIETIFRSLLANAVINNVTFYSRIDSNLYQSYNAKDLRKTIFFRATAPGNVFYKGSYDGSFNYFSGIATDEIYLVRSESNARLGNINEAMRDINTLMSKRWKNDGSFVPFGASDQSQALSIILTERRKELVHRSTRWSDLRRLNKEGANITITRIMNNQTYTLSPNDKRYTFLIPQSVISFHPKMPQNPR